MGGPNARGSSTVPYALWKWREREGQCGWACGPGVVTDQNDRGRERERDF